MINGVIRQELSGQLKALGNRLAGLINRLTIISAAGYYANIAIIADLIDQDRYSSFEKSSRRPESGHWHSPIRKTQMHYALSWMTRKCGKPSMPYKEGPVSILIYKQRHRHPNYKKTPKGNYAHIGYIATRPGAVKMRGCATGCSVSWSRGRSKSLTPGRKPPAWFGSFPIVGSICIVALSLFT